MDKKERGRVERRVIEPQAIVPLIIVSAKKMKLEQARAIVKRDNEEAS
jgi:hypothetical protein